MLELVALGGLSIDAGRGSRRGLGDAHLTMLLDEIGEVAGEEEWPEGFLRRK